MNIEICKTCKRFRETEKHCVCNKAQIVTYNFWKSKNNFIKEGKMCFTTFFNKEMPRGCKYAVGKKEHERGKREYDKCMKCKHFQISSPRYKCTLDKGNIFCEKAFSLRIPDDRCINKIEHIICMEAIK